MEMDWFAAVDSYCERVGPGYWAEPLNAMTNLAFVLAAAVMWPRVRGLPLGRLMCVVLAVIGLGSWLFHTHAQAWAGVADVVPILVFILLFIFAASRDFLGLRPLWAGVATAGFVPYAAFTVPLFAMIPGLGFLGGLCAGAAADPDLCGPFAPQGPRHRARHGHRRGAADSVADLPHT